jgi:hypothetical protein
MLESFELLPDTLSLNSSSSTINHFLRFFNIKIL